jgi:hypothetical protein
MKGAGFKKSSRVYLVGSWVVGKADVAVDAEVDVFEGQLRDGRVCLDDLLGDGCDVGFPVFERPAVLCVARWGTLSSAAVNHYV